VLSSELVPGDVYEVSDPSLTQFPCDSLLLAGDCIVNESMLTGKDIECFSQTVLIQQCRGVCTGF
jgi:P-type E1-E2 ATPase